MVRETWVSYVDKIKRYYSFSIEEKRNLIVISLVLGFIYSFKDWGLGNTIDVAFGLTNLLIAIIIAFISIYVHVAAQRLHALRLGYKPELKTWPYGLMGGVIICFITNGAAVLPLYGGTEIHMIVKHRIGHFRHGVNMVNMGLVAMMGPLANLFLAYFIKIFNVGIGSSVLNKMILINLMLAVWTMLPIPPVIDGVKVFFWSRLSYFFIFGAIASAALLIWITNNLFFIFFGSMFVGAIIWFIYYIAYEEDKFEV